MANPERPLLEPATATTLQAPHANTCNCPQTCKDLSGNSSVGLLNVISEVEELSIHLYDTAACDNDKLTNPPTIVLSFAVVRGWWSAIVLSFAVIRGWWPAIVLSHLPPKPNFTVQNKRFARFYHLPRSGVGGLLLSYHLLWSGVGGQLLLYHICHQNQIS